MEPTRITTIVAFFCSSCTHCAPSLSSPLYPPTRPGRDTKAELTCPEIMTVSKPEGVMLRV